MNKIMLIQKLIIDMNENVINDVFRNFDTVITLINNKNINNDEIHKIFQNINLILNRGSCFSGDGGKLYIIIKSLFDNHYEINSIHLDALFDHDDGPYFYYYQFENDLIQALQLFIKNNIYPQEHHIDASTSLNVVKFLYENGFDFINSYINKNFKKNRSRYIKDISNYLKDKNDFYNRVEIIEMLKMRKVYDGLVKV